MKNEIVLFTDGDINIEVELSPELETVWLTQKQMGEVFEVKQATLSEHINNIISSGELDETSIGFSDKSSGGRKPKIYNLDMILSVGYRVNSKRGIAFRRWANSVLKKYVIQGYAINEKRLQAHWMLKNRYFWNSLLGIMLYIEMIITDGRNKMEYRKFDNVIIARIDKGEEILEQLKAIAINENIKLASINALGAINDFTIGVYKTDEKKYYSNSFKGYYEITSLTGTINTMD